MEGGTKLHFPASEFHFRIYLEEERRERTVSAGLFITLQPSSSQMSPSTEATQFVLFLAHVRERVLIRAPV